MNDTQAYPVEESKNDLIRKLDAAVNETKMKPVWRDAYMMYRMRLRDEAIKNEAIGEKKKAVDPLLEFIGGGDAWATLNNIAML